MNNKLLINFPEVLSTERLNLRLHRPGDGPLINDAVRETFGQLHRWFPWAKSLPTIQQSELFARQINIAAMKREQFSFFISLPDSPRFMVANAGIHHINWDSRAFEFGYWCRKSCQGNGYITEAVQGLSNILESRFRAKRLVIRCDSKNQASAFVAEKKLGFKLEGCHRKYGKNNAGRYYDVLFFAKIL